MKIEVPGDTFAAVLEKACSDELISLMPFHMEATEADIKAGIIRVDIMLRIDYEVGVHNTLHILTDIAAFSEKPFNIKVSNPGDLKKAIKGKPEVVLYLPDDIEPGDVETMDIRGSYDSCIVRVCDNPLPRISELTSEDGEFYRDKPKNFTKIAFYSTGRDSYAFAKLLEAGSIEEYEVLRNTLCPKKERGEKKMTGRKFRKQEDSIHPEDNVPLPPPPVVAEEVDVVADVVKPKATPSKKKKVAPAPSKMIVSDEVREEDNTAQEEVRDVTEEDYKASLSEEERAQFEQLEEEERLAAEDSAPWDTDEQEAPAEQPAPENAASVAEDKPAPSSRKRRSKEQILEDNAAELRELGWLVMPKPNANDSGQLFETYGDLMAAMQEVVVCMSELSEKPCPEVDVEAIRAEGYAQAKEDIVKKLMN